MWKICINSMKRKIHTYVVFLREFSHTSFQLTTWQYTVISRQYQFDYNLFDLFKKPIKIMTQFMLNSAVNIIISNL